MKNSSTSRIGGESSVLSGLSRSALRQSSVMQFAEESRTDSGQSMSTDIFEKHIFPLVAEANRSQRIHSIFRMFEFFWISLQIFFGSYFLFLPGVDAPQGFIIFIKVLFIGLVGDYNKHLVYFIVLMAINLITGLFLLSVIIDYSYNHEYKKLTLKILRIWHGHIYNIFIIPNMMALILSFGFLGEQEQVFGIIICVLTILSMIYCAFHSLYISPAFCRTPFLTPSPVHAWNPRDIYFFILAYGFPYGFDAFFKTFEFWYEFVPFVFTLIISGYYIYRMFYFPFRGVMTNAISAGVLIGTFGGTIMALVRLFIVFNHYIMVFVPIGVLIIGILIMYFILKARRTSISNSLLYARFTEEQKPTEDVKREYITENLKIRTVEQCYMNLQIGLEDMCDLFVDWSLHRLINDLYPKNNDLLVFMTWFASFFPSEIHFLHTFITLGAKMIDPSVDNRCLYFQLHRVHIFRQSSASREATIDFNKVKKYTDHAINANCRFWSNLANPNIEFNEEIYEVLSNVRQQAEAAWSEALDKYPNNSRFTNEYSRYLLDAKCQFKESIKWHQRANQIEQNKRLQNDRMFHHFVLTFPSYLKKGIVDTRGTLKGPRFYKDGSSAAGSAKSTVASTTNSSELSSVTDLSVNSDSSDQIDLVEGSQFLSQAPLRLALERAVSALQFPINQKIKCAAIIRLLATLIYTLIVVFLLTNSFAAKQSLFTFMSDLSKADHHSKLSACQLPWFVFEGVKNGFPAEKANLINDMGPNLAKTPSYIDLNQPLSITLYNLTLIANQNLYDLGSKLYSTDLSEDEQLKNFSDNYLTTLSSNIVCDGNATFIEIEIKDDQITSDYAIKTFLNMISVMSMDSFAAVKNYTIGTNPTYCEIYYYAYNIDQISSFLSKSLSIPVYNALQLLEESTPINGPPTAKLLNSDIFRDHKFEHLVGMDKDQFMMKFVEMTSEQRRKIINMHYADTIRNRTHADYVRFNSLKNKANKATKKMESGTKSTMNKKPKLLDEIPFEEYISEPETSSLDELCDFLISFTPFFIFIFVLPSIIFLSAGWKIEQDHFSKVLQSFSRQECLKASEKIQKLVIDKQTKDSSVTADASSKFSFPPWVSNIISAILTAALLIVLAIMTKETYTELNDISNIYVMYSELRNSAFESYADIAKAVMFRQLEIEDNFNMTFHNSDYAAMISSAKIARFNMLYAMINLGYQNTPTSIGLDEDFDQIRFEANCDQEEITGYKLDYYRCTSFERVLSYYVEELKTIASNYKMFYTFNSSIPYLAHMIDSRLAFDFLRLQTRLEEVFNNKIQVYTILTWSALALCIIFTIIAFVLELLLTRTIDRQLETFKCLMLRLNPISFVGNQQIVALVYGKQSLDNHILSAAHAVFITSHDAMISLNSECVIESLNPSATTIFGYTPEQMLGQHLKMLISPDIKENGQMFYTMQLMKSGQCGLIYEADLSGTKDDGTNVPLKITLLGFSNNNRIAESFAVMCRDQTIEIEQKTAVEEAKKQSENLLLQILPKDIIVRLNRGDKDITFTVPSATIIFIDIEKFSNYSATLSPCEIMQNLGMVFTAYDKLIAAYPLMTKIKLIGDDYMAAGGLFTPDQEPSGHSNQCLQFALQCLDAIEDLNEQLNASLQVRIGINTAGPLIAGVLGTDKPLFDIIGDPINVAARLQSTDIPGFIQISQGTYNLVADGPYHIEQRGEIELKGKGKQMTYLVHQNPRMSARSSHKSPRDDNDQGSIDISEPKEQE